MNINNYRLNILLIELLQIFTPKMNQRITCLLNQQHLFIIAVCNFVTNYKCAPLNMSKQAKQLN